MLETSLVALYLLIGAVVGAFAAVAFVREFGDKNDSVVLMSLTGLAGIIIGVLVSFCWLPIVVGYAFTISVKDKN